jgi:hypothetical protein
VDPSNPHLHGKVPAMSDDAVIDDYVKRVVGRPAFARAQARDSA